MKKFYSILCAAALAPMALAAPTQAIKSLTTASFAIWQDNYYNKDLNVSQISYMNGDDEYNQVLRFSYNDLEQIDKISAYQDLDPFTGGDCWQLWKNTYVLEYTYNEAGQVLTRTYTHNLAGLGWTFITAIVYEYDENGNMVEQKTYVDELHQYLKYDNKFTYNEANQLVKEDYYTMNDRGRLLLEKIVEYTYGEDGLLTETKTSDVEDKTGDTKVNSYFRYTYDAQDNVVSIEKYGPSGTVVSQKYVFYYDTDVKSEDVVRPHNPEVQLAEFEYAVSHSPNAIIKFEEWRVPQNVEGLVKYDDWTVNYETIEEALGVDEINAAPALAAAVVTRDAITFAAMPAAELRVFAVDGRLVLQAPAAMQLGIAALPAGSYVLVSGAETLRFVK